tara:strand:+ start:8485 stop:9135 length:651 start_codon:yes stop_codon:yes gene_type:complete
MRLKRKNMYMGGGKTPMYMGGGMMYGDGGMMYGDGGMMYDEGGKLKMVEKDGKKVPFFLAEEGMKYGNGGMQPDEDRMTMPPRAMGRDRFATDQYFAEKGMEAALRQDMRKENRMANREGRRTGYFPARPSDTEFLLKRLENPETTRDAMVNKGFRNESARMLARNALLAALGLGVSEYTKTPKTVQGPLGPGGQPVPVDLNTLQRIGMMLGLGPY